MKKIKSIKQLQVEKKLIQKQQRDQENRIRGSWKEFKQSLKPGDIASEVLQRIVRNKTTAIAGESVLKNTLTYGLMMFANKLLKKAGRGR